MAWKEREIQESTQRLRDYDLALLQQQEAVVLEARRNLDVLFRQEKKKDWRSWVGAHSDLFHILQTKRMIAKHCGKLANPMPGLRSADGQWKFSRDQLATAWQDQFAKIENAEFKSMEEMLQDSNPCCEKLETWHLQEIPTLLDVECAWRALKDSKAAGLDGLGRSFLRMIAQFQRNAFTPYFSNQRCEDKG